MLNSIATFILMQFMFYTSNDFLLVFLLPLIVLLTNCVDVLTRILPLFSLMFGYFMSIISFTDTFLVLGTKCEFDVIVLSVKT